MTNEITSIEQISSFIFDEHDIRIVRINGEPWFVLIDVCRALEMDENGATTKVAGRLDDDQRGVHQVNTPGGLQTVHVVSESGLYEVVMRSDKPKAKEFRRWITGEVLPSIRKNGSYALGGSRQAVKLTPNMLRAIADSVEWMEVAAPKAAAHDRVMEVDGGWYVATVARMFDIRPRALHEQLREWGATYKSGGTLTRASEFWCKRGWLKKRGPGTPVVTPDGLREMERRFGKTAVDPETSVPVLTAVLDGDIIRADSEAVGRAVTR